VATSTCKHPELDQLEAVQGDHLCPLCLQEELQGLQLKESVRPGLIKQLQHEVEILYRVIEKLGGK